MNVSQAVFSKLTLIFGNFLSHMFRISTSQNSVSICCTTYRRGGLFDKSYVSSDILPLNQMKRTIIDSYNIIYYWIKFSYK